MTIKELIAEYCEFDETTTLIKPKPEHLLLVHHTEGYEIVHSIRVSDDKKEIRVWYESSTMLTPALFTSGVDTELDISVYKKQ